MAGLSSSRVDMGPASILWAATARTPVSVDATESHAALLLGDALLDGDRGRARAGDVAASWLRDQATAEAFDGFHAAAVVAADGRVAVGADVLGYFPVYYAAIGDVLLAGASPEPFRWHPAFREAVSLEGLLTVLLFGGPFGGHCILAGVSRLGSGRLLQWRAAERPRETPQYDLPKEHQYESLSLDEQVELVHHAYQRAHRRHHPVGEPQGLLLSGGLDSRLVAGYLRDQGNQVEALTVAQVADYERICASAVARELGITHHVVDDSFLHYEAYAGRCARWEHLAGGLGTMLVWETVDPSRRLPLHTGNGYTRARERAVPPAEFPALLRDLTSRAIGRDQLRAMLRTPQARELLDGIVERFERFYESVDDVIEERGLFLYMETYARFYLGSIPWRLSFGSWPVMTELDREFQRAWTGVPFRVMQNGGMREPILRRYFPRLARLPMDRNAVTMHPLAPSRAYRARQWMSYHLPWATRPRAEQPPGERRIYFRQYDLDNPGWLAVRQTAEPGRAALEQWFDPAAVDRIVPRPDVSANVANPMTDGFDAKTLLGLMLWSLDHRTT